MYDFAIVALLGLACWKFVGTLLGILGLDLSSAFKAVITLGVGVVGTAVLDYSLFAGWDVAVRTDWMGPFFSGLIVGSMAYVWHYALGWIEAQGRRNRDEAREIERRGPQAA